MGAHGGRNAEMRVRFPSSPLGQIAREREVMSIKTVVRFALSFLYGPIVLFSSAGRLDWPQAWAFIIILTLLGIVGLSIIHFKQPDLIAERKKFLKAEGIKKWDKILAPMVGIIGPLSIWIIAGLDERFDWSQRLPLAAEIAAFVLTAGGYAMAVWAMSVNKFFSSVVRIQKERGHTVVSAGPYKFVRHPGYAGAIIAHISTAVLLGSVWALIPAFVVTGLLVTRTILEERTLKAELAGYSDYARKIRYRLIPFLW